MCALMCAYLFTAMKCSPYLNKHDHVNLNDAKALTPQKTEQSKHKSNRTVFKNKTYVEKMRIKGNIYL